MVANSKQNQIMSRPPKVGHDSEELKAVAEAIRRDVADTYSAALSQHTSTRAFVRGVDEFRDEADAVFEQVVSTLPYDFARHASLLGDDATMQVLREVFKKVATNHYVRERIRGLASSVLDLWAIVLPQRIVNEDLSDYIEDIARRIAKGQRWKVYLRVVAAIFWTGVNTVRYFQSQVSKKAGSSSGQ